MVVNIILGGLLIICKKENVKEMVFFREDFLMSTLINVGSTLVR